MHGRLRASVVWRVAWWLYRIHCYCVAASLGERKAETAIEIVDQEVDDLSFFLCVPARAFAVVDLTGGHESRVAVAEKLRASIFLPGTPVWSRARESKRRRRDLGLDRGARLLCDSLPFPRRYDAHTVWGEQA